MFFFLSPPAENAPTRKRWAEMRYLWDVVEERSASGAFEGLPV
jgi:hypothetical protein